MNGGKGSRRGTYDNEKLVPYNLDQKIKQIETNPAELFNIKLPNKNAKKISRNRLYKYIKSLEKLRTLLESKQDKEEEINMYLAEIVKNTLIIERKDYLIVKDSIKSVVEKVSKKDINDARKKLYYILQALKVIAIQLKG